MMNKAKQISLAIDTSVSNGSFSIWRDNEEIDFQIGDNKKSRSSDILEIVNDLLLRKDLSVSELKEIIYTIGPGSYTGLRVGIATVLGLSKALSIPAFGVTVLEAYSVENTVEEDCLVVVPLSNNKVAIQDFTNCYKLSENDLIKFLSLDELSQRLIRPNVNLVSSSDLFARIEDIGFRVDVSVKYNHASDNVAGLTYKFFTNNKKFHFLFSKRPPIYSKIN